MKRIKGLLRGELIGHYVEVIDSKNESNIGLRGKVIDETRNTVMIETENGNKRLIKKDITIQMQYIEKKVNIEGALLVNAPEERIKKPRFK